MAVLHYTHVHEARPSKSSQKHAISALRKIGLQKQALDDNLINWVQFSVSLPLKVASYSEGVYFTSPILYYERSLLQIAWSLTTGGCIQVLASPAALSDSSSTWCTYVRTYQHQTHLLLSCRKVGGGDLAVNVEILQATHVLCMYGCPLGKQELSLVLTSLGRQTLFQWSHRWRHGHWPYYIIIDVSSVLLLASVADVLCIRSSF